MNFSDQKPIYIQISDTIVEKILRDRWQADERIPSVREFGADLGLESGLSSGSGAGARVRARDRIISHVSGLSFLTCTSTTPAHTDTQAQAQS